MARRPGDLQADTLHPDVTDKAKALPRNGADHGLILAVVADRLSRGIDPAGQCRVGDRTTAPNPLDQIIFGNDMIAALDQIGQQVEYLWFDRQGFAATRQFATIRIKHIIRKEKLHTVVPGAARNGRNQATPRHVFEPAPRWRTLGMTLTTDGARSRSRGMGHPRFFISFAPSSNRGRTRPSREGAGKTGCALHPRSHVQWGNEKCAHEHTGSAEALRPSLRNGLTTYTCSPWCPRCVTIISMMRGITPT
jgi:hypothetical protein